MTLSIAIATYNETKNITRCLNSVKDIANEIIIVDGKSNDNTIELAKKFSHVKIITTDNKPNFHLNKQMAIDACTSDWILQLDADEELTPKLAEEIKSISLLNSKDKYDGYWINRKNYFLGKFLSKGGVYPDPTIRLYRRGLAYLPCKDVHEQVVVNGTVGRLNNDLQHYSDPTFSRYLLRNNRYTTLLATDLISINLKINFVNFIKYFILKPLHWFFLAYFLHRGYVDGFPGFVFAWYSSLRFPISYIKVYENRHQKDGFNTSQDWE